MKKYYFIAILIAIALLSGCNNKKNEAELDNNIIVETNKKNVVVTDADVFSVELNGYFKTCDDNISIYKLINNSWEKVFKILPENGMYFVNDQFVDYSTCDAVVCSKLPNPLTLKLIEYKEIGQKMPPKASRSTAEFLPVFQSNLLTGEIKIDIQYFSDENCQTKKTFFTVINI